MKAPILHDLPEAFETERLLIRAPRSGDGPLYNAAVLESFDRLSPWMPWAQERPSVEQSEEYSRKACADFIKREDMTLRLLLKDSLKFIGSSGLHVKDWKIPHFEIGYWVRTGYEGAGYVREAVEGILWYGFELLNARRIQINCDPGNERSIRIARRVGMTEEGRLRNALIGAHGEVRDVMVFGMTNDDWAGSKSTRIPIQLIAA